MAKPDWDDPLDPSYAQASGGRWNPPSSYLTLYLSADVPTARLQVERMLEGYPARLEDASSSAFLLVATTLPGNGEAADAVTDGGLDALGLPDTYPVDSAGERIPRTRCQPMGRAVHEAKLKGVWCRSACTVDGRGREVAWFPTSIEEKATPVWDKPRPLDDWRSDEEWKELGLPPQSDPESAQDDRSSSI